MMGTSRAWTAICWLVTTGRPRETRERGHLLVVHREHCAGALEIRSTSRKTQTISLAEAAQILLPEQG